MKAEKQDSRLVQSVCAEMAGLECAALASAAQCQQARQSMQKRSANGHHAKEDCAGGLRDVIGIVLADHGQLGRRAPVLQMLCSRRSAALLRQRQSSAMDARERARRTQRAETGLSGRATPSDRAWQAPVGRRGHQCTRNTMSDTRHRVGLSSRCFCPTPDTRTTTIGPA